MNVKMTKKILVPCLCLLLLQGYGQTNNDTNMNDQVVMEILASQYKASLKMLRQTIKKTPEELWDSDEYPNPNWQMTYHALWATKFYLTANPEGYQAWPNAIEGAESLGGAQDWENPEEGVVVERSHTKEELISFIEDLEKKMTQLISSTQLHGPSGFEWYPYSRLELHINNIRHLQHHTAQLIERLKIKGITGFPWAIDGSLE